MKIALVCSKGGHLQEMYKLEDAWSKYDHFFITYDSVRTRALKDRKYLITHPTDGCIKYVLTIMWQIPKVILEKPDVLLSTGMGWTDIFLFPVCRLIGTHTIYVESLANVDEISGTAKLVRKFANRFLVQWPKLAEEIGAEYHGGLL